MTWRRLRILIQQLPPESATMTAIRGAMTPGERERAARDADPETGRWSQVEHLLATIADRVARLEYITTLAHSGPGARVRAPEPIPRPGITTTRGARRREPLTQDAAEGLFQLLGGGAQDA